MRFEPSTLRMDDPVVIHEARFITKECAVTRLNMRNTTMANSITACTQLRSHIESHHRSTVEWWSHCWEKCMTTRGYCWVMITLLRKLHDDSWLLLSDDRTAENTAWRLVATVEWRSHCWEHCMATRGYCWVMIALLRTLHGDSWLLLSDDRTIEKLHGDSWPLLSDDRTVENTAWRLMAWQLICYTSTTLGWGDVKELW